jgi:dihydrofolate synthase/folylpolyglutamate synthase
LDHQHAIDDLLSLVDHELTIPPVPRQKLIYDLARIKALLERLGNPHLAARTIHIAGTNGKGSVAAYCEAVLSSAGYRTGLYSSPHLHNFRERIRCNAEQVAELDFDRLVEEIWPQQQWVNENVGLGQVSLFEFMTAMAFQYFAKEHVEVQIIEVGLGGRLDATNLVRPDVCVITPVSFDHTAVLGDSLAQIAVEKAGIIKSGASVVVAPQSPEVRSIVLSACREKGIIPIIVGDDVTWDGGPIDMGGQRIKVRGRIGTYDLKLPLLGTFQLENASTAIAALEVLGQQGYLISDMDMSQGFAQVSWPCRFEVLSTDPLVVVDGAHNVQAVTALLASLPKYLRYRRVLLVVGFSKDKDVAAMAKRLSLCSAEVFATRSRHPRATSPSMVATEFQLCGISVAETGTVAEAVNQVLSVAQLGDLILGTGSLFVAAEMREILLNMEPELYPDLLSGDKEIQQPIK